MKKILLILFASVCLGAMAQVADPNQMVIRYKDNTKASVDITGVESITFAKDEPEKRIVGEWTAPTPWGLWWGHTSSDALVSTSLVFGEEGTVFFKYTKSITTHEEDYPEKNGTVYEETIDNRIYTYTIDNHNIRFYLNENMVAEMEFYFQRNKLTLTLMEGSPFPPMDVVMSYYDFEMPDTLTYTRQ